MPSMEELLSELIGEDRNEQGLPPGFRFHPTDEELITFYLASKVFNGAFCGVEIAEVDLNRCEPWDLPDMAKMGEKEWYFFSLRDRKYPTGLRTNRATGAGYWKATGKDREVYSASTGSLLGMKKTLVFYKGRAPRGEKTKWVMHEYRLDGDFSYRHTCKEEWVICRIFHKNGEKKNGIFQAQGFFFEATSTPTTAYGSLPSLLEAAAPSSSGLLLECQTNNPFPSIKQDPNHHHNHIVSFTTSSPIMISTENAETDNNGEDDNNHPNSNPSPSMLLKSLLSNHHIIQDCNFKEQSPAVHKQGCKIEPSFSHFQLPSVDNANNLFNCWVDKIHHPNTNTTTAAVPTFPPLSFEMDCNVLGISTEFDSDISASDLSTSIAFNRADFQMMLDTPIRFPAQSWPLDSRDL